MKMHRCHVDAKKKDVRISDVKMLGCEGRSHKMLQIQFRHGNTFTREQTNLRKHFSRHAFYVRTLSHTHAYPSRINTFTHTFVYTQIFFAATAFRSK